MPAGKEIGGGRRGGSTTKKNAFCSFCRKSYRDVGPLVEGPGDVYICGECIELCQRLMVSENAMVDTQRMDTDHCQYKGSWDPIGPWGGDGGRVYSTAIMALCLEVFYRYDRVFVGRK